jgi:hypothetical protein
MIWHFHFRMKALALSAPFLHSKEYRNASEFYHLLNYSTLNKFLCSVAAVRMPSASCFKSAGSSLYCPLAANLSTIERIQSHSSPCLKHTTSFKRTSGRVAASTFLGSSIQGLKALQLHRAVHTSSAVQCAMAEAGTKEALSKLKVDDAVVRSMPPS